MNKEKFEEVNQQIKDIIKAYLDDPFLIPIDRKLSSLYERLKKSLGNLAKEDLYIKEIVEKMQYSLDSIVFGDISYITDANKDSFHMLLWNLHQYLIKNIYPKME